MYLFLLFLVFAVTCNAITDYTKLGTKGPYRSLYTGDSPVPAGCTPKHFNFIARHGTRYPTSGTGKVSQGMVNTFHKYKSQITNPAYAWLTNFTLNYNPDDFGDLTLGGANEHIGIATRLRERFPLLRTPYREDVYHIQTTQSSRAAQSATAFAMGLFNGTGTSHMPAWWSYSETPAVDNYLRYYENCVNYLNSQATSTSDFQSSSWQKLKFPPIADRISALLGGENSTLQLETAYITWMWAQCKYDFSIDGDTKFCEIFEDSEVDTLNYQDDLEHYYENGYGYPLNYQMAATLMNDIILRMNQSQTGTGDGKLEIAKLRFAHQETVVPLLAFLGVFKDSFTLSYDSAQSDIDSRLWRTTTGLGNYALNLIFDMYSCSSEPYYRVRLLMNEQEIIIPGCPEVYCNYSTFLGNLGNYPSFETVCTPTQDPTLSPTQTPTLTPTQDPALTPTLTPTQTPQLTPTQTQSPTQIPTQDPAQTQSPTQTPVQDPALTPAPQEPTSSEESTTEPELFGGVNDSARGAIIFGIIAGGLIVIGTMVALIVHFCHKPKKEFLSKTTEINTD